jgi:hypothetical protein
MVNYEETNRSASKIKMTSIDFVAALISLEVSQYDPAMREIQDKIKTYVREMGYTIGQEQKGPGVLWMWPITDPKSGFNLGVGQLENHPESLAFVSKYELGYETERHNLSPQEHKELFFKIHFRLLPLDVKFTFPDNFSAVSLSAEVFVEDLSRRTFWEAFRRVSRSLHCVNWSLDEKFKEPFLRGSNGH